MIKCPHCDKDLSVPQPLRNEVPEISDIEYVQKQNQYSDVDLDNTYVVILIKTEIYHMPVIADSGEEAQKKALMAIEKYSATTLIEKFYWEEFWETYSETFAQSGYRCTSDGIIK